MTAPDLLAGKVVLVSGAGQGVGEGIARALASAGASVVIAARRAVNGEPVAAAVRDLGGSAVFVRCDVTDEADVHAAVAAAVDCFGGLDAMIHNAVSPPGPPCTLRSVPDDTIAAQIATSTTAAFYCAQASFEHLRTRRGSLILLTSPAGIEGSGNLPVYAAVKGAQRGLLKSLAREWGPAGVRVNAMAPVARTQSLAAATAANPALEPRLLAGTPLGRIGDPETDVGAVAVFLASGLARHMTGQTLAVDGGRFLGL